VPRELSEEEISANRMQWVAEQIADFRRGFIDKIRCPYCQALNRPDTEFCCDKMMLAAAAVCDTIESQERKDLAEEIADRVN
jgi:hypothetical protein